MAATCDMKKKTYDIIDFTHKLMRLHDELSNKNAELTRLQKKKMMNLKLYREAQDDVILAYEIEDKDQQQIILIKKMITLNKSFRDHFETLHDMLDLYKNTFENVRRLFQNEIEEEKT